ncbi:MAG: DUF2752 domain-containing protein [Firmicutes bacterium]|nr:DUF2752 domain-containing protein [Bacillota bacterium]
MANLEKKNRNWKPIIGFHLLFLGLGIFFLYIFYLMDISCLLRYLTGIPCPTCGATRAMFSLFRLDFFDYFYFNPMALPLVIAFLAVFHINLYPQRNKMVYIYVGIVVVLTIILYVYRLFNGLIP